MHFVQRFAAATSLSTLLLVAGLSPVSAVQLDTPSISTLGSGATSVIIQVQAGPSGALGGFTLEWMKRADFNAQGGWPADPSGIFYCQFIGEPTLNTTWGTSTFLLESNGVAVLEAGDLFDETGMYGNDYAELDFATDYVFRVRADAVAGADASEPSADLFLSTATPSGTTSNCTFTIGYWKTHGPVGCVTGNNTNQWPVSVLSFGLTLGNVNYTAAQLCSILQQPAQGNGLLTVAHQLIAAKLNIAQGASIPAAAQTAMNQADAIIGNLVIPPVGGGSLAPGQTSGLTQTLDSYNNGVTGPGHCGNTPPTATTPSTWGALKGLYR